MPNPATLHHRSTKIEHYLKIVDLYIYLKCPKNFLVEPDFKDYKPDVYMIDGDGNHICVEVQLTPISTKKMQQKFDQFASTYNKQHNAKNLLLVSDTTYDKCKIPTGFKVFRISVPKEPYS